MKHFLTFLLFFAVAIFIIIFNKLTRDFCIVDMECEWKITNCCKEEGAMWECVNKKTFVEPECPKYIICPRISSPKPNLSCECENWKCVVK